MAKHRKKRLARGELEARVLDVLWDADQWATPAEVGAALHSDHPLAYTSVMTILVRLWKKGVLERRLQGRGFAYRPLSSREASAAEEMHELLSGSGNHVAALTHFLDCMDKRDRTQLRRLLDETRRR